MPKYNFHWTGEYLTIDDAHGKRIGFKCASKRKAKFLEQLVNDANLGTMPRDKPQIDHSPDLDNLGNYTE
jgi:hypothetical protein